MKLGVPAIANLATAVLGLVNFLMGFANVWDGDIASLGGGYFAFGASTLPALFLIGGLLALPAILPGDKKKPGIAPAAFAVSSWLTILFFTFTTDPDVGIGSILLIIFGLLQTVAAVGGYLLDAGIVKMPARNPYGHHQPPLHGGAFPPSGQFPAAQPPQQQQPGQFGAPPGQQTTFAPQQGQFGQPPQPGTPPGGYPQQG
ncbi:DUF5336 domain-containing protein [Actinophytocola oryzae]|nr:DUF5336 domain-containing protein [Actinophytocola oryzae]